MAYQVFHVNHANIRCPRPECEKFDKAKRYIGDKAGEARLRLNFLSGIPIPEEFAPRRAVLRWVKTHHKQTSIDVWREVTGKDVYEYNNPLFDITAFHFGWLLSQAARDLVEAHEPGVHQLFPFEVLKKDGSPIERPFWLLNICNRLDAVAPEASTVVKLGPDLTNDPDDWWYQIPFPAWSAGPHKLDSENVGLERGDGGAIRICLRGERIAGHALWADSRFKHGPFLSDGLLKAIESAKLEGLHHTSHLPEM